jgi:hypothetical protein
MPVTFWNGRVTGTLWRGREEGWESHWELANLEILFGLESKCWQYQGWSC